MASDTWGTLLVCPISELEAPAGSSHAVLQKTVSSQVQLTCPLLGSFHSLAPSRLFFKTSIILVTETIIIYFHVQQAVKSLSPGKVFIHLCPSSGTQGLPQHSIVKRRNKSFYIMHFFQFGFCLILARVKLYFLSH